MCPLMHRSYSLSLVCAHQYFPLSLAPRFVHFCKPSATPNSFQKTGHLIPSPLFFDILYYIYGSPLFPVDITLSSYWFPLSA